MSVYGDTYNTAPITTIPKDPNEGQPSILEPLPIVKQLGTPYNYNNNKIAAANNNIDYNNLIVRDQNTGTGIEPQKTGILEKLKNFDLSKMPSLAVVKALLPKQDPRSTALKDFYGDNFGTTSSGSVASGIMANYNPVSGGLLNMLSGGKYGDETNYGLGRAIDKRIAKINQTLNKYDKYKYGSKAFDPDKYNQQIKKLEQLEKIRAAELAAQQEAKEQTARELRNAQEAAFAGAGGNRAAQDAQRRADAATVAQANRDYSSGASYSGGESTPGDDTSYNDPFDPGGGEKDGGHIDGTNRRRYGMGGIVSL